MLELWSFAASISYLLYWYFSSVIRRRLQEVDGGPLSSLLIFNMPSLLRRYWLLALDRHWSRLPVLGACVSFCGGVIFCFGIVIRLLASAK
jgi:hypothetical protein